MRRRSLTVAVLTALLASGCSGGDGDPGADADAPPKTAAERLETARAALENAGSVSLDLKSTDVPSTENGVTAATGAGIVSATEPKFSGTVTGTIKGVPATVQAIAIGEDAYLKLFTPEFEPFDLDTINAPNPATFFDPAKGIAALLSETGEPTLGGQKRAGSEVLDQVSGTLPAQQVADLFHLGEGAGEYAVTYGLTEADELRTATLVGPFFGGGDSTYTLTLTGYGIPVEITRP